MHKAPMLSRPWTISRPCSRASSANRNNLSSGVPSLMTANAPETLRLSAMLCMQGQGVVKGYAIGKAAVMSAAALEVAHYRIAPEDVEPECERLKKALATARDDLQLKIGRAHVRTPVPNEHLVCR